MPAADPLSPRRNASWRRRDIARTYANAGLWGVGNGLVGSALIIYFARSQDASGLAIGLIIASPQLVGVLRLFAPVLQDRIGNRRLFCLAAFSMSGLLLGCLPAVYRWREFFDEGALLLALVVVWTLYHLAEFFGVVALWSWIADLVPRAVRGRYVGRRIAWMNAGRVLGTLLGIAVTARPQWFGIDATTTHVRNDAYALCMTFGTLLVLASVAPLAAMREIASPTAVGQRPPGERLREVLLPFADRRFWRLLAYGGWFSFSNGVTSTAQYFYQIGVVKLDYWTFRTIDTSMKATQTAVMPRVGGLIDRVGAVRPMIVCQLLVAVGLACYLPATTERWWWIAIAYVFWIAYAGINVGMPHLMLQLAQPKYSAAYIAAWFAWTKLVYGLTSVTGGQLVDWLRDSFTPVDLNLGGSAFRLDHLSLLILIGVALRLASVAFLARIREE